MNYSKNKLLATLVALLVLVGVGTWAVTNYQANQDNAGSSQDSNTQAPTKTKIGRTELSYSAQPGITSLEQLKQEAGDVVTTQSDYGELVDSIEGHKGGTDEKYWSFYVNGEMAQVGAGAYVQKEGDYIEWKFQKL